MRLPKRSLIFIIVLGLIISACGGKQQNAANPTQTITPAPTPATEVPFTASLSEVAGGVLAREAKDPGFAAVHNGFVLPSLGQVQTQTDGKVRLDFSSGSLIRIGPGTLFTLEPPQADSQGLLIRVNLAVGRLWVILQGGSLEVETKSGVAAVRGSYMSVSYNPDSGEAVITCLEGTCTLSTPGGNVEITAGQTATVSGVNQPPQVGKMTDSDVQDWLTNNPEATVVVPPLTQIPAQTQSTPPTEAPVGTNAPESTQSILYPLASTPVPTKKSSSGEDQSTAIPSATATRTATPTATQIKYLPTVAINSVIPESSVVNQSTTISISVLPGSGGPTPTGTVSVSIGGTTICSNVTLTSGSASCNYAFVQTGAFNLVAAYSGDGSNLSAQSAIFVHNVNPASITTTTSITSDHSYPAVVGAQVDFSASVDLVPPGNGSPTGQVVFSDGTDSCTAASAPWSCSLIFTSRGSKSVKATYSGDANFSGSTSTSVTQVVVSSVNLDFSSVEGPGSGNDPSSCVNNQNFKVTVVNTVSPGSISSVDNFVEYSINDSSFSSPTLVALYSQLPDVYQGISNIQANAADTIYWRFSFKDGSGNQSYYGGLLPYAPGDPVSFYSFTFGSLPSFCIY